MTNAVNTDNIIPAVVGPQIIFSTKEIDGKLSDVVRQVSNVEWNYLGITYLSRPPSKTICILTMTQQMPTRRYLYLG